MQTIAFSFEMAVVMAALAFTIFLFVSEIIRIDLAALLVLVLIGILSYLPGLAQLADVNRLFDGFASKKGGPGSARFGLVAGIRMAHEADGHARL